MAYIKKKHKRRSGRKKIVIDWQKVDFYLKAGCNGAAVARLLNYHPDTLYNAVKRKYKKDFSAYRTQKTEEGVALVEGTIFKDSIEKGGIDRIFWLKNRAKWADKTEVEHTGSLNLFLELIQKATSDGPGDSKKD